MLLGESRTVSGKSLFSSEAHGVRGNEADEAGVETGGLGSHRRREASGRGMLL